MTHDSATLRGAGVGSSAAFTQHVQRSDWQFPLCTIPPAAAALRPFPSPSGTPLQTHAHVAQAFASVVARSVTPSRAPRCAAQQWYIFFLRLVRRPFVFYLVFLYPQTTQQ